MTVEKALEILKSIEILSFRDKKRKYFMRDVWEAKKVAIKALEQQPCEDYISRRAVKDMLTEEWTKYMPMELDTHLSFVLEKISELPSVTPSYNSIKTELDCVSRQEVLDVLKDKWNMFSNANDAMEESIDTIKALPPVTPIPLPKNATNGDMIMAMFPDVKVKEKNNVYEVYFGIGTAIQFYNRQWWNAPYKAESEDKE